METSQSASYVLPPNGNMGPPQPPTSEQSGSPAVQGYNIPPPLLPAPKPENGTFNGYPTPSTSNMSQNGSGAGGHYFEPTELFSPAPSANGTPGTGTGPTNGSSGSVPIAAGQVGLSPGAGGGNGNGYVVMARQGSGLQQPQQPGQGPGGMNGAYQPSAGVGPQIAQQQQQQQQQGQGQYMYPVEPIYVQSMGRQPGYPGGEGPAQHAVYK